MASSTLTLPPSCSSSFHGSSLVTSSSSSSSRISFPKIRQNGRRGLVVKASESESGIVLVDRSENEKTSRLKTSYLENIVPILKEEFSYTNLLEVPKIEKIVVNCGIGEAAQNAKGLDAAMKDLATITGQRPVKTRARVSIATFKLREGQPIGLAVTLRGNNNKLVNCVNPLALTVHLVVACNASACLMMYSFLDRLVNLGLPRTRDFQGVNPNSFDGHGNYSIGMREQSVFPEIAYDALGRGRGMDVCITTTAKTDKEAQRLLALMGMPFREGGGPTVLIRKKKKKAHHFDSKSKGRR
ncbi:hypothetical protein C5167_004443 [Papaver somniferum]|uniref:Large ribosomal subunit protein uL5c n=1 Tax=Papaver somniferum TaxID=3469 RepID=A0A4Y7JAQ0_PAPSO|nr:hypothetical protein C5167_004443 [Papaver somniferum]